MTITAKKDWDVLLLNLLWIRQLQTVSFQDIFSNEAAIFSQKDFNIDNVFSLKPFLGDSVNSIFEPHSNILSSVILIICNNIK